MQVIKGVATGWDALAIYVTIKNTDYYGSGEFEITSSGHIELPGLGWDLSKSYPRYDDTAKEIPIGEMMVGDVLVGDYGMSIIRIA